MLSTEATDRQFREVEEIGWVVRTISAPPLTLAVLRQGFRVILDEKLWQLDRLFPTDFESAQADLDTRVKKAWDTEADIEGSREQIMLRLKDEEIKGVIGDFQPRGFVVLALPKG